MKKTVILRAAAGLLAAAMLLTGCREKRRTPDAEAEGKILTVCISRTDWSEAADLLTERYLLLHPEIADIRWELIDEASYWDLMNMKLAMNQLPDIMDVGAGEEMDAWYCHLSPVADERILYGMDTWILKGSKIKDVCYTVPVSVYGKGILYNTELLKKAGWHRLPENRNELEMLCEDLEQEDIRPFMNSCYNITSCAETDLLQMISMKAAPELYIDFLKNGNQNSIMSDRSWDQMMNYLDLTIRYGNRRSLEMDRDLARNYFFIGKYAMLTNDGAGCIKGMREVKDLSEESIVIGPLLMSEDSEENRLQLDVVRLGAVSSGKNREDAFAFMSWLARSEEAADILKSAAGALPVIEDLRRDGLTVLAGQTCEQIQADKASTDMNGMLPRAVCEDNRELWAKYIDGEIQRREFLDSYQQYWKSFR